MATELVAHRRQQLAGELAEAARLEPLVERGSDHRGGHALVDRREHRPAALSGVAHPTGELGEVGRLRERVGGEVDEPRSHDRAAAPHLRDLRDVDVVLVVLRVAQRGGLGVDLLGVRPGVGVLDDAQTLRDRGHHPVLDPVVDHLHEVAGAARPAVEVAVLRGAVGAGASRRGLDAALARRDGAEDRVEAGHRGVVAADHEAVAAVEPPHAAAGAAVDVVHALLLALRGAVDVVVVIGVAAVDDGVVGAHQREQLVDGLLHDPGRDHDPDVAGRVELLHELLERVRPGGALGHERVDGLLGDVVDDARVPVAHEAAYEVRAHAAKADHAELHRVFGGHCVSPTAT